MTTDNLSVAEIERLRKKMYEWSRGDTIQLRFNMLCDMALATARRDAPAPELAEGVEGLVERLHRIADGYEPTDYGAAVNLREAAAALARQQAEIATERERADEWRVKCAAARAIAHHYAMQVREAEATADALKRAVEKIRDRDDRNGSLPETYRKIIDEALTAAQGEGEAREPR